MRINNKQCLIFFFINICFCLFAQSKKTMAAFDFQFEKLELMSAGSNENLDTKYGTVAADMNIGDLKADWLIEPVKNDESVFTRTENGFILERKIKFQETWQGNVDSPRFIVYPKKKYRVSFRVKASKPVTAVLTLNKKGPPWDNAGLWQSLNFQKDFKNYSYTFTVPTEAYCAFSITELGHLSDVTIELEDYCFEELKK